MVTGDPIAPGEAALGEAKAYLRLAGADEDAIVERMIKASAELCEQFTGQAVFARGFAETLPASRAWQRLARTPVRSVTAVEALSLEGGTALAVEAYAIDIDANGDGWVRLTGPGETRRVRIAYQAGLAEEWAQAPEALRHGILRLAAHLYAHRDRPQGEGPPAAVTALWRPWRRLRLA